MGATRAKGIFVIPAMIMFMLFVVLSGKAQTNGEEQIKGFKEQIAIKQDSLKEAKKFLWSDRVAQLNKDIDSLKQEIAFRTPAKEVKAPEEKVAKAEKPAPIPSIAKNQVETIGKTTERGQRVKMNTINVNNYVNQAQYSNTVANMQLAQMAKDSMGLMQMRPNCLFTYTASGQAARSTRYGQTPQAYVEITPADANSKNIKGAMATRVYLQIGEEKEMFLPNGEYNVYYYVAGQQQQGRHIIVRAGAANDYYHNKAYCAHVNCNVNAWNGTMANGGW
ncbi:MAG: hypothetical protein WCK37_04245 [Candidatus Falkowbacteria bacterium]